MKNKNMNKSNRRLVIGGGFQQAKRVDRQAFVACLAAVVALPASLLSFGVIPAVLGLVLAVKAKREDGTRPVLAKIAIVVGIISCVLAVPGTFVMYGTYINPDSAFVHKVVNALMGTGNIIGW